MSAARTYLDWNASAPLRPEARAAMIAALDLAGNPSSVHGEGRRARAAIEDAREAVARLVGAEPADVVFTSGATEANAWVIGQGWGRIFMSDAEHDSVRTPAVLSGAEVVRLRVGGDGVLAVETLADRMERAGNEAGAGLLALQAANNETGVVQPVAEAAALAREHGLAVLCDAVQVAGRRPLEVAALGVDYLTISAHKLGGPKGIGALVCRRKGDLVPLIAGGGQERRRRAGTENVAAIAGFGAAAAAAASRMADEQRHIGALRDRLEAMLAVASPSAMIIGVEAPRLSNTTCVALPGRLAEVLVASLDLAGIAVSAGAACSSGKVSASATLQAMGLDPDLARAAIRISIGPTTTQADITVFLAAWSRLAEARKVAA